MKESENAFLTQQQDGCHAHTIVCVGMISAAEDVRWEEIFAARPQIQIAIFYGRFGQLD